MDALSREDWSNARSAIYSYGRPVDIALFEYHFEEGTANDVLLELSRYQNEDGGFGNAIEPDFRLDASSPLATSIGLQYVDEVNLPSDHPVVKDSLNYLVDTWQSKEGYWPATFENVNEAPHAIWWHIEKVEPPSEAEWPNPNAELLGYLWQHRERVPEVFLQDVTERAARNISATKIVGDDYGRRYAILCWERALPHLPSSLARDVRSSLELTLRSIDIESELRELYSFAFVFSPESTVVQLYPELVDRLLAADVKKQSGDGGWWPNWNWGQYEETWPQAEREWVGKLTLDCLLTLKRFDKLS